MAIKFITDSVRESFIIGHRPTGNAQDVDPQRPPKGGSAVTRARENQSKASESQK
jgi:hypothetical protein